MSTDNLRHPRISDKQITIPLVEFLNILIGDDLFVETTPELATLIHLIDRGEDLCHVEFPSTDKNKDGTLTASIFRDPIQGFGAYIITAPQVWWINHWRDSVEKNTKLRAQMAEEKRHMVHKQDKIDELAKKLRKELGLESDAATAFAVRLITTKNYALAKQFGVTGIEL